MSQSKTRKRDVKGINLPTPLYRKLEKRKRETHVPIIRFVCDVLESALK